MRQLVLVAAVFALSGCEDLRGYAGEWSGELAADPHLAVGFAPASTLTASIGSADRAHVTAHLTLTTAGTTTPLPFVQIERATGDILADAQLPGEPLRTFFGFSEAGAGAPYLTILSLFPENRIEVRLIRGNDTYAVFSLKRPAPVRK